MFPASIPEVLAPQRVRGGWRFGRMLIWWFFVFFSWESTTKSTQWFSTGLSGWHGMEIFWHLKTWLCLNWPCFFAGEDWCSMIYPIESKKNNFYGKMMHNHWILGCPLFNYSCLPPWFICCYSCPILWSKMSPFDPWSCVYHIHIYIYMYIYICSVSLYVAIVCMSLFPYVRKRIYTHVLFWFVHSVQLHPHAHCF